MIKMTNGKKKMEMSTTKTWKLNFVVLVHSRSQGLFTLAGTGIWKMDMQHKDLPLQNEVIMGFYKQRTAKVLPVFRDWHNRKKQSKKLQTCLSAFVYIGFVLKGRITKYVHTKENSIKSNLNTLKDKHRLITYVYGLFFFPQ